MYQGKQKATREGQWPEVKLNTQVTVDSEGNVTETVDAARRGTVQFEYSLQQFGNGPKAAVTEQASIPLDASEEDYQTAIARAFEEAKARVFEALSVPYTVDEGGVVVPDPAALPQPEGAKSKRDSGQRKSGQRQRGDFDPNQRVREAWLDLQAEPDHWFDNRNDKQGNPKRPDFKGKRGTDFEGFGLWLVDEKGRTPEWAVERYGV